MSGKWVIVLLVVPFGEITPIAGWTVDPGVDTKTIQCSFCAPRSSVQECTHVDLTARTGPKCGRAVELWENYDEFPLGVSRMTRVVGG